MFCVAISTTRERICENILNRVIIVNLKFIQISLNEFVIN